MTRKVLIFGTDIVPLSREMPATGAGLRIWQFYNGLLSAGFDVRLSLYEGVVAKYAAQLSADVRELAWSCCESSQRAIIDRVQPDALVVCHWPTWYGRDNAGVPMALDFHGPHLLERHYQQFGRLSDNMQEKLRALRAAQFFTCAGHYQRDYFAGWLLQAGVVPDRQTLVSIPISQSPELPPRKTQRQWPVRFVYSGVFLPWQDPFDALTTATAVLHDHPGQGRLEFFGGPHPVHKIDTDRFTAFERAIRGSAEVQFHGFVNRQRLLAAYEQADVAFDLMRHNSERELAFTTRTVEYLWSGLPVIYNNYAELAEYIADYQAGWCLDPEDPAQLRQVLESILANPAQLEHYAVNAQRLAREQFDWTRTVAPLAEFCRTGHQPTRLFHDRRQAIDVENTQATGLLAELLPGQPVEQVFRARQAGLCSVALRVAGFGRVNHHRVQIELTEVPSGRRVAHGTWRADDLEDNGWAELEFDPCGASAGREYRLRLAADDSRPGGALTFWSSSHRGYPFGSLRQAGQELPGTLCLIGRYQAA